jgi:hypothetical protein
MIRNFTPGYCTMRSKYYDCDYYTRRLQITVIQARLSQYSRYLINPYFRRQFLALLPLSPVVAYNTVAPNTDVYAVGRRDVWCSWWHFPTNNFLSLMHSLLLVCACYTDECRLLTSVRGDVLGCPPIPFAVCQQFLTAVPKSPLSRCCCCVAVESHLIDAPLHNSDPGREYFWSSRKLKCPRLSLPEALLRC